MNKTCERCQIIDKVTWCPTVFAVCTSEEKANAAKEALEKRGYGATKLRVVVSNLFLDQIRIGEEIINL